MVQWGIMVMDQNLLLLIKFMMKIQTTLRQLKEMDTDPKNGHPNNYNTINQTKERIQQNAFIVKTWTHSQKMFCEIPKI